MDGGARPAVLWRAGFGGTPPRSAPGRARGRAARWRSCSTPRPGPAAGRLRGSAASSTRSTCTATTCSGGWTGWCARPARWRSSFLFWHDHFASATRTRRSCCARTAMFRRHALGGFRRAAARRAAGPADAALPVAGRLRQGRAERELRPRADGALHAGRAATPSTTSARPPGRSPAASRVAGRAARLGLRPRAATTAGEAIFGHRGRLVPGRAAPLRGPPGPPAVPGAQALVVLRRRAAGPRDPAPPQRLYPARGTRSSRWSGRDPRPPRPLRPPRGAHMVKCPWSPSRA